MDSLRLHTPHESPHKTGLEKALSDVILFPVPSRLYILQNLLTYQSILCRQQVQLERLVSGHYDNDAFILGEGICDGVLGGGIHRTGNSSGIKIDSLQPKALESAFLLDVQNIACSEQHVAWVIVRFGSD
ncbi:hypothetical protein V6N13_140369 [Hibiscus sabdariffa]|uniref:Uncharacterized protein n=1 Tax=Hibiscus sabdariffa TaxID=183260 RepID=A0ABR2QA89_9ROSI